MKKSIAIGVVGVAGKMGSAIARNIAQSNNFTLTLATIAPNQPPQRTVSELIGVPGFDFLPEFDLGKNLSKIDVLIDFTTPSATLNHAKLCVHHHKAMVIGTTGFSEAEKAELSALSKQIPIVFAPNMSRGVNVCLKLIEQLAKTLGAEADIHISEAHHRHKKDAPSGTALKMGEIIAQQLGQSLEDLAIYDGRETEAHQKKILFSVIREGDMVGEHTLQFTLPGESIEIKHSASNRDNFAQGALAAAQWVLDKTPGLYSMADVLSLS